MTIDEIARKRGVIWELPLMEFNSWLSGRRQEIGFATMEEAIAAWRASAKSREAK